jgi:3-dehydroquinate dehydratase
MEREAFRHHSYVSLVAKKTYMGLGFEGYRRAVRFLVFGEE